MAEPLPPGLAALVALNADLRRRQGQPTGQGTGAGVPGLSVDGLPEMKSLAGFRRAWSQVSAESQVTRALESGPDNAGPLNSHRLVLHTLERMRALSPAYLSRYLSQLNTLLWLEQAEPPSAGGKPARRGRTRG